MGLDFCVHIAIYFALFICLGPNTPTASTPPSIDTIMGTKSLSFSLFLLFAFLLHFHLHKGVVVVAEVLARSEREALGLATPEREALEIIIGGGGGGGGAPAPSPDYPPPPCPLPPPRPLSRLEKARRVLLNFKTLIDDPKGFTQNWNEHTTDTCKFNGIRCAIFPNSNEQAVAGVDLNQAGIAGQNGAALSLSGILGSIPELTFFHVNSNNFSNTIPNQITNYPFFFELDLSNNKLAGEFPNEVLQSKQLVFLDLRFNRFSGPIPSQLFQLDLDVIFVNNNQFNQYLPDNFGSTPARYLTFANNRFTGPIPKSIGNANNTLTEVLFLNNQFEGCLPYEIGYLKKAVVFDVSRNYLTGPIPYSFACLQKIRFLNLARNKFYGLVPENVCELPGIRNNGNLSLSDNYFTEIGPACRKLLKSKILDVTNNCIPGLPNQRSPKECYAFLYTVKPCPNHNYYFNFVPCKRHSQPKQSTSSASSKEPVTYKSLKPHRLRF